MTYYSKALDKTFAYQPSPNSIPQKSFVWKIDSNWGNSFISIIEPTSIIDKLTRIDYTNLTKKESVLVKNLETVDELDNPVLFIVKMKEY